MDASCEACESFFALLPVMYDNVLCCVQPLVDTTEPTNGCDTTIVLYMRLLLCSNLLFAIDRKLDMVDLVHLDSHILVVASSCAIHGRHLDAQCLVRWQLQNVVVVRDAQQIREIEPKQREQCKQQNANRVGLEQSLCIANDQRHDEQACNAIQQRTHESVVDSTQSVFRTRTNVLHGRCQTECRSDKLWIDNQRNTGPQSRWNQ
jgi:hypothetical protein